MKRINEKVKDIVEVRKFQSLRDFSEDAAATLSAYRFTDATSDLMTKWLDRIARLPGGEGAALALAGYRGVGKSHFLATLSAIVSSPDLRTKIGEAHVATAAQALLRRRYPCMHVRRGRRSSLVEEFKASIAAAFEVEESTLPEKIFDLVAMARARSGDVPFLVLVDTAMERSSRVTRDDGSDLTQIAEAVIGCGGFIGVALDDDIEGADGSNAAIVRTFSIDYLDQEHLYKVVDTFVFPKNQLLRPVLHDVYEYFREVIPSFRWSEQRFTSLYPLHPAILDVAPFVRLYVNDFALLSFAAEAGERILGRPANSLIALDEVFDSAETELRKVDDLKEAFAAYDRLNSDVVARIPVMQRLQAKLILKALLILSLEGQGTTAGEISSGTLIFDETDPKKASKTVEEIIRMFANAMPDDVRVSSEEGREVRYGLKVSGNDGVKQALETAAASVDDTKVAETLHRLFHERFSDSLFVAPDGTVRTVIESTLAWRGGQRRGRVFWKDVRSDAAASELHLDDLHDWEVVIDLTPSDGEEEKGASDISKAIWRAAELTPDERDAVKRFWVLQNDQAIREEFSEQIRGAFHSHLLILDRAISRIFFEDGRMTIDAFDYNLSEEARTAATLSGLFSEMLEPLFETRFPQHPYFLQSLGVAEVSSLVSDLYSGSKQKLGEVQQLAQTFALPLGLVKLSEGVYYPATKEHLLSLELVKRIEAVVSGSGSATTDLKKIYEELRKSPYGLVREAQQLILAAMVSQRLVEFVTSKGDRINQRSLDLRMIWDDIVGLARPQDSSYSAEKLAKWAKCFAEGAEIVDIGRNADLAIFRTGAEAWLAAWDSERLLGRFNEVPEESLNTVIWKAVTRTSRTFGASASLLRKWFDGQGTVEECLGRIAEAFLDDVTKFEKAVSDLEMIRAYLESHAEQDRIRRYLATAAFSGDPAAESAREETLDALRHFDLDPDQEKARHIGYTFSRFHASFTVGYLEAHDSIMRSHKIQEQASELLSSENWWLFENVSELAADDPAVRSVKKLIGDQKRLDCAVKTVDVLATSPRCTCGFEATDRVKWESLVADLEAASSAATKEVLERMRYTLEPEASKLASLAPTTSEPKMSSAIKDLEAYLNSGKSPASWTPEHIRVLRFLRFNSAAQTTSRIWIENQPLLTEDEIDEAVLSLA